MCACAGQLGCAPKVGESVRVVCKHTAYLKLALEPSHTYTIQEGCYGNLTLALRNRVLSINTVAEPSAIRRLKRAARVLSKMLHYRGYVPIEEWTSGYTGLKKARYIRAHESLVRAGLTPRDNKISAFVKIEKVVDGAKDPRLIQFRSARYACSIAGYLKGMEESLYSLRGNSKFFPPGKLIAKGCTPLQRGYHIRKAWDSLRNPVQLALDCSRFDAHVNSDTLAVEHLVYTRTINDPYFSKIIRWQDKNFGVACDFATGQYCRYTAHGKRMSGDMNTALGNCVLMLLFVRDAMEQLRVPVSKYRIFDDGDDCALFVEEEYAHVVITGITDVFKQYGHDLKVESVHRSFESVTLCGCKPLLTDQGWLMMMEPQRLLGKIGCVRSASANPKHLYLIGECLLNTYPGIPIVSDCAKYLMRVGKPGGHVPSSLEYSMRLAAKAKIATPSYTGNFNGLYDSWGITGADIDYYRGYYASLSLPPLPTVHSWFETTYLGSGKNIAVILSAKNIDFHNADKETTQQEEWEDEAQEGASDRNPQIRRARRVRVYGRVTRRAHIDRKRGLENSCRYSGRKDGIVCVHAGTYRNEHSRQFGQGLCPVPRQERSPGVRRSCAHDQCHCVYHRARFRSN